MLIATINDGKMRWQQFADLSVRNLKTYSRVQGYDYRVFGGSVVDASRPASWSKLLVLQKLFDELPEGTWCMWHDVDSYFMNMTVRLEEVIARQPEGTEAIFTEDLRPSKGSLINGGNFLVQNTPYVRQLLVDTWNRDEFAGHAWYEQRAFNDELRKREGDGKVAIVECNEFNSSLLPESRFQRGDLVFHAANKQKQKKRAAELARYSNFDLNSRDELGRALNCAGLLGKGVEVGVRHGKFADTILTDWAGETLYCVDRWCHVEGYQDICNVSEERQEASYQQTVRRLAKHGERAAIIRAWSSEAVGEFEDGSLDFVYIDADHSYEGAKADIDLWLPKVRRGGVLCGHDYLNETNRNGVYGVKRAVDERFGGVSVSGEAKWKSWFYRVGTGVGDE